MNGSEWFAYQLQSTLDGLIWSAGQLPRERYYALPPSPLGEWAASQHIFHMLEYERDLALPSMYQWLGAPPAVRKQAEGNDPHNLPAMEEMLLEFQEVRQAEIALLSKFAEDHWNTSQNTTFWGAVNLSWLVSKTYQHTLEHTHDILRIVLFWDRTLKRTAQPK